jgi:hypothetical protein
MRTSGRLLSNVLVRVCLFLPVGLTSMALSAGAANAASVEECQTYADAAMRQVQENAQAGYGLSGGNWSDNRDAHLAWCLQNDVRTINAEWEFRENELQGRRCDTYAAAAMRQIDENAQLGCGLAGGNWAPDADAHRAWCVQNPGRHNAEWEFRQNELNQCKARLASAGGGGGDNNGGGGGGGGGAGGSTAAIDTTIYDEPDGDDVDYLTAGDPVTIVGCNEDNWCQIRQPRRGWVWGDDLNQ